MARFIRAAFGTFCISAIVLLTACSTHDPPAQVSTDPLEHEVAIMEVLTSFEAGDEIYVAMRDGSGFRARYQGHSDSELEAPPVMLGWRAIFTLGLSKRQRVYSLSEILYVSKSRPAVATRTVLGAVTVFGLVIFASYALAGD